MELAVIRSGGKQYVVQPGQRLTLERLGSGVGEAVTFDTLLVARGDKTAIGEPLVPEQVMGKVVRHYQAEKISVVKYKSKVRYRRRVGHRQQQTVVLIEKF